MKKTKKDILRINESYNRKLDEYMELPLEELLALQETGKVKGTYEDALIIVIKTKRENKIL